MLISMLYCSEKMTLELNVFIIDMRMNSVQTEQQLVYAVKCLISYAWTCGVFYSYPDLIKVSDF